MGKDLGGGGIDKNENGAVTRYCQFVDGCSFKLVAVKDVP